MPIILKKISNIEGDYTDEQKDILDGLITHFRTSMLDYDADKNILDRKKIHYTDNEVIRFLNRAMGDINGGQPRTEIPIYDFANHWDDTLIVDGAVVFALMAEGILQLRNQVDYNDSGLTIAMFNKSPQYQGWVSMLLNAYMQSKADFKAAYLAKNQPSLFHGVGSEFGYYYW